MHQGCSMELASFLIRYRYQFQFYQNMCIKWNISPFIPFHVLRTPPVAIIKSSLKTPLPPFFSSSSPSIQRRMAGLSTSRPLCKKSTSFDLELVEATELLDVSWHLKPGVIRVAFLFVYWELKIDSKFMDWNGKLYQTCGPWYATIFSSFPLIVAGCGFNWHWIDGW